MKRLFLLSVMAFALMGVEECTYSKPAKPTKYPMLACHITSSEVIGNRTRYIGEVFEVTESNVVEHCEHQDQTRIRAGLEPGDRCALLDTQMRPCRVRTKAMVGRPAGVK
ncbi:MAG: hypothetical protein JRG76_13855 [Deltaproteobacteria bacterium]|nr:hypothetical protein [Deltaproteobacteria bacterium]MBW2415584.1 hypothetical protein [Deltaproteobacteria bacterium]